jgi:hypothetical protein
MTEPFNDKIMHKIRKVAAHFKVNEQEVILAYKSVFKVFKQMVNQPINPDVDYKSIFIQRIGTFYPKEGKVFKIRQYLERTKNKKDETDKNK